MVTASHETAAQAVGAAVADLNRALIEAHRAGLVVDLVVIDAAEMPNVRHVVVRCAVPVSMDVRQSRSGAR